MKVALAQTNPVVGDLAGNKGKILANMRRAEAAGADLVVFGELAVTGYPPRDLLHRSDFVDANLDALAQLASKSTDTAAIIGFVDRDKSGRIPGLLNAAALVHRGKIISVHHKSLLPTYDVFDEVRYFSPAESIAPVTLPGETNNVAPVGRESTPPHPDPLPPVGGRGELAGASGSPHVGGPGELRDGISVGISVCEDAWNDGNFWSTRRYAIDPVAQLVKAGAEILVNVSASPYVFGKRELRTRMLSELALKHRKFLVFVNQVGGNDELVFDGHSAVFAPDGRMIAAAAGFAEDFLTVELDPDAEPVLLPDEDISCMHDALVLGLRDYVTKTGFSQTVVGLSGGIDSAVTAALAVRALGPENVRGIGMPGPYSSEHSVEDARSLAHNLGIRFDIVPITDTFRRLTDGLVEIFEGTEEDITEENIQARIRGTILMAVSNKFGLIVLATGNKTELSVGYCTIYGDMCGGLAVIGDVPKMGVYELARYINREGEVIPQNTIEKPPSAELKPDQTDQDSLPPYEVLDGILRALIEEEKTPAEIASLGFDKATVRRVIRMVQTSEFKRKQAAPVIKVTSKAFGTGRRMPIVNGWRPEV